MPNELPWASEEIIKVASLFCGNFRKSLRESSQPRCGRFVETNYPLRQRNRHAYCRVHEYWGFSR